MGGRLGAMVMAALTALNIALTPVSANLGDLYQFVSDPLELVYTYPEEQLDSYFDQSVIYISDGPTYIDGVPYGEVWLSNKAAEKFRVNAFDFKTAYDIASHSNGTFASGVGYVSDAPLFDIGDGAPRSQIVSFSSAGQSASIGDYTFTSYSGGNSVYKVKCTGPGIDFSYGDNIFNGTVSYFGLRATDSTLSHVYLSRFGSSGAFIARSGPNLASYFYSSPFDFDYVAGEIPADTVMSDDEGLKMLIPWDDVDHNLRDWVEDHPDVVSPAGGGSGVTIDMSLPDVKLDIESLIDDIIMPLIPVMPDISIGTMPVDPSPVDPTTIANTPWVTLDNRLSQIISNLAPISLIKNGIDIINTQLPNVISNIQSIGSNISSAISSATSSVISSISSLGDRILEDIEQGPIRVFNKALDLLKSIFSPALLLVKNAIGIWHYVVEWISGISAPFSFFLGCYQAVGTVFMMPIYACIAGYIVIAVYRRFGR